jgi:hypothetical protein
MDAGRLLLEAPGSRLDTRVHQALGAPLEDA